MGVSLNIVYLHAPGSAPGALAQALRGEGHAVHCLLPAQALGEAPMDLLIVQLSALNATGGLSALQLPQRPRAGLIALAGPVADKVAAYAEGADLCLNEPLEEGELTAAVRALARRLDPAALPAGPKPSPPLQLDITGLRLHGPTGSAAVSAAEAALLAALSDAPGQRLPLAQMQALLGRDSARETPSLADKASLEVRIVRLRAKLRQLGIAAPGIQAVRRYGYQLCVALSPLSAPPSSTSALPPRP